MLHGVMLLHSRSGELLYSQRCTPKFGLQASEQLARDDLRLGAMLFALVIVAFQTELNDHPTESVLSKLAWRSHHDGTNSYNRTVLNTTR